ncbi:hypothetical protein [Streptomyces cyslabdanicus]|uniref:hypothetical protein n=1 Tax=Streptomyces cyslabdanicus TaxID=1470456 RepID=UPI004043BC69
MRDLIIPESSEGRTKEDLLAAIRKQTAVAACMLPREGAAALRDLAEAYSALTVVPLPLLHERTTEGPASDGA